MLSLWIHGMVGSCFLFGCHELGHGTVFRTKWLNRMFLYTFSLLSWWDPFDYAMSHTHHHKYTQYVEADRENVFPVSPYVTAGVALEWLTINLTATPGRVFGKGGLISHVHLFFRAACGLPPGPMDVPQNEWIATLHADAPKEAQRSMHWSQFMLAVHAGIMYFAWVKSCWVLPFVVSFHSFIGNWLRNLWGMTQHAGLRGDVPDFRKSCRTIILDPVSEFFYWHMNYHIEHHMFANTPCYNLKALHKAVAEDMPAPRSLYGAWKEMLEIHARQQKEPLYTFDTPLPTGAGQGGKDWDSSDPAELIGDLAPPEFK